MSFPRARLTRVGLIGPALCVVALVALACGGGGRSATAPSTPSMSAVIADALGDALPHPELVASPDIASASIVVDGPMVQVTIGFAPGTLSRADVLIEIALDTDENPSTGASGINVLGEDSAGFGMDYLIEAVYPPGAPRAALYRVIRTGQYQLIGGADVSFPSSTQLRLEVELRLLGADDGRMNVKLIASQWLDWSRDGNTSSGRFAGFLDYAPDLGQPPATVR